MGQSAVLFWNRGGKYVACKKYGRKKKGKYRIQRKCTGQQHLCQKRFAVGACEYRRLPHCAPYGIYTRPAQGEDLMILSAQSGEVCLGVVSQQQEELLPGEILLKSSGGASIRLCNDGTILLNGKKVE